MRWLTDLGEWLLMISMIVIGTLVSGIISAASLILLLQLMKSLRETWVNL